MNTLNELSEQLYELIQSEQYCNFDIPIISIDEIDIHSCKMSYRNGNDGCIHCAIDIGYAQFQFTKVLYKDYDESIPELLLRCLKYIFTLKCYGNQIQCPMDMEQIKIKCARTKQQNKILKKIVLILDDE